MNTHKVHTDIAIIGGGVAGLWALNHLRSCGYSALLFEQEALGSYQSIGSQGMIHGGIKYALGGALNDASEAIAAMPERWRIALSGKGLVDLTDCQVLSDQFHLWSTEGPASRLSTFLASKLLRGRVRRLAPCDYPEPLRNPSFRGQVYSLIDLVLDIPSLVSTLERRHREYIFQIDWQKSGLQVENRSATLSLSHCEVHAQRFLLTAGSGNEALISALGARAPAMQRRPLRQVLVKHEYRGKLFGHCLGKGSAPRLTISTHETLQGEPVWYLGGNLASDREQSSDQLIDIARRELEELLPWIDLGKTDWRTLDLERAEPRQSGSTRPDTAFVDKLGGLDNVMAAWPTKLTLCPELGDRIETLLNNENIQPRHRPDLVPLATLPRPGIAAAYWDTLFQ